MLNGVMERNPPLQAQAQRTYKLLDQGFPTCENCTSGHGAQLSDILYSVHQSPVTQPHGHAQEVVRRQI